MVLGEERIGEDRREDKRGSNYCMCIGPGAIGSMANRRT
jgi:hypothetical protein